MNADTAVDIAALLARAEEAERVRAGRESVRHDWIMTDAGYEWPYMRGTLWGAAALSILDVLAAAEVAECEAVEAEADAAIYGDADDEVRAKRALAERYRAAARAYLAPHAALLRTMFGGGK